VILENPGMMIDDMTLVQQPFFRTASVNRYQNVFILHSIGAKDDGVDGDNWSYRTHKAPVQMSSSTNEQPAFYRLDASGCKKNLAPDSPKLLPSSRNPA